MSHPSCCSRHQAGFIFGHHPRKPIILNAWFQLWNMEPDPWWFGQQYLAFCCSSYCQWLCGYFKYHWITVVSFREQDEKQIPSIISQATRRRVVKYSTRDYSEFTRSLFQEGYKLCCRQMCIFHSCSHYVCPSPVHAAKLYSYSLGWLNYVEIYRGADRSLAWPGRKLATVTEDFEFHISYL